jgi:hypothetical protein
VASGRARYLLVEELAGLGYWGKRPGAVGDCHAGRDPLMKTAFAAFFFPGHVGWHNVSALNLGRRNHAEDFRGSVALNCPVCWICRGAEAWARRVRCGQTGDCAMRMRCG